MVKLCVMEYARATHRGRSANQAAYRRSTWPLCGCDRAHPERLAKPLGIRDRRQLHRRHYLQLTRICRLDSRRANWARRARWRHLIVGAVPFKEHQAEINQLPTRCVEGRFNSEARQRYSTMPGRSSCPSGFGQMTQIRFHLPARVVDAHKRNLTDRLCLKA